MGLIHLVAILALNEKFPIQYPHPASLKNQHGTKMAKVTKAHTGFLAELVIVSRSHVKLILSLLRDGPRRRQFEFNIQIEMTQLISHGK